MIIITVINHKGGVGKTTTASALAFGCARAGIKTLLIDLDQQRSLTDAILPEVESYTMAEVLREDEPAPLADAEVQISSNLSFAPAGVKLAGVTSEDRKVITNRLRTILQGIQGKDIVILDTPPALSSLTAAALAVSTGIIIPTTADAASLRGLAHLYNETIQGIINLPEAQGGNPNLKIYGALLVRYNGRSRLAKGMQSNLAKFCEAEGIHMFKTAIRENISLAEAQALRKSIFDHAPRSNGAKDYAAFIKEVSELW